MSESILIVDDEPAMRRRLTRILQSLDCADDLHCAADLAQGKATANGAKFAMALVDLGLPDGNGIELIGWLRARDADLPILVISAWSTEEMILGALRAGASGYVLKERDDLEIAVSLRSALKGGAPIDPFIARRILGLIGESGGNGTTDAHDAELRDALSKRELTILRHVAQGMSNREIADAVKLSQWTIESHIKHIYAKLAVNSRTQAIHVARQHGLLH